MVLLVLLSGRRARPTLLRSGVAPRGTKREQYEPSLRELARLGAVTLHARSTARFAGFGIRPLECKSKPRPVVSERVIVHHDPYIGSFYPDRLDLGRIGLPRDDPVALFVVTYVMRCYAVRNEVILALMPNLFPSVE